MNDIPDEPQYSSIPGGEYFDENERQSLFNRLNDLYTEVAEIFNQDQLPQGYKYKSIDYGRKIASLNAYMNIIGSSVSSVYTVDDDEINFAIAESKIWMQALNESLISINQKPLSALLANEAENFFNNEYYSLTTLDEEEVIFPPKKAEDEDFRIGSALLAISEILAAL